MNKGLPHLSQFYTYSTSTRILPIKVTAACVITLHNNNIQNNTNTIILNRKLYTVWYAFLVVNTESLKERDLSRRAFQIRVTIVVRSQCLLSLAIHCVTRATSWQTSSSKWLFEVARFLLGNGSNVHDQGSEVSRQMAMWAHSERNISTDQRARPSEYSMPWGVDVRAKCCFMAS